MRLHGQGLHFESKNYVELLILINKTSLILQKFQNWLLKGPQKLENLTLSNNLSKKNEWKTWWKYSNTVQYWHSIGNSKKFAVFQILFDTLIYFIFLIKLHMDGFENFVKSMLSCIWKLKVLPSFCFPNVIFNNLTASKGSLSYGLCFEYFSQFKIDSETYTYLAAVLKDGDESKQVKLSIWKLFWSK